MLSRHAKLMRMSLMGAQLAECMKHLQVMHKVLAKNKDTKRRRQQQQQQRQRRIRSCCVKQENMDRQENGYFVSTFLHIKSYDAEQFFMQTRMDLITYNKLLALMEPLLAKHSMRESISAECRLALTLNYLSQGVTMKSIASSYKIGHETTRRIILETCEALWQALEPIYLDEPSLEEFEQIAHDFYSMWQIPNCIGAVDGRHIPLVSASHSKSLYNAKQDYSMILMGACNAAHKFTYVDIATHELDTNGDFFRAKSFCSRILSQQLNLPVDYALPGERKVFPHYLLADKTFPTSDSVIKPFAGQNLPADRLFLNERIARAVRSIENTFGILAARWRILQTCFHMLPDNAEKMALACVALHNFIMAHSAKSVYCPAKFVDWQSSAAVDEVQPGEWRQMVDTKIFRTIGAHKCEECKPTTRASQIRDRLTQYFAKQLN